MLYALDRYSDKIRAFPGGEAICPYCKTKLIPKCGEINIWHWSHKSIIRCDRWSEGETDWHLGWKADVRKLNCEVIIKKRGKKHIADIVGNNGVIIELQNSPISVAEIKERELFYGNMIWLFNAESFIDKIAIRYKDGYFTFNWHYPRKRFWYVSKPLFLDIGNAIYQIRKIYKETPSGGWGIEYYRSMFINQYLSKVIEKEREIKAKIGEK